MTTCPIIGYFAVAWGSQCHFGCQPDEPLVTSNRIINVYGLLVVILLPMYVVLHCLCSIGNKLLSISRRHQTRFMTVQEFQLWIKRQSHDRLILTMDLIVSEKNVFILKQDPGPCLSHHQFFGCGGFWCSLPDHTLKTGINPLRPRQNSRHFCRRHFHVHFF